MWTTCSASINGGGSLTQEGTGTLILTGPNTYSGGITINSGSTLQVGNGTTGGLGCTSSITNYGSLVLDTNAYYLGAISGGGSLTVSGGTVYLNAANAYSGVTIWGGGTLELCGTAASINYNVSDYGTLAFGCSGTTTYSGVISGGGSLTQNGGTLILTGANTYIGGTTVSEGTLQLGSQDAAEDSTVIVNSPGALVSPRASSRLTLAACPATAISTWRTAPAIPLRSRSAATTPTQSTAASSAATAR